MQDRREYAAYVTNIVYMCISITVSSFLHYIIILSSFFIHNRYLYTSHVFIDIYIPDFLNRVYKYFVHDIESSDSWVHSVHHRPHTYIGTIRNAFLRSTVSRTKFIYLPCPSYVRELFTLQQLISCLIECIYRYSTFKCICYFV